MATKKTRPEHVETVDPATEPGVVDLSDADSPLVTIGEPANQPTNQPVDGTANLTLSISVPVEAGGEVDFSGIVEAVERAIGKAWPDAVISDLPAGDGILETTEEIPPGHSARTIIHSDEQWSAIDRQATRNKSTGSQWLRRFLHPYLRRG
jgi:hypothetical protein